MSSSKGSRSREGCFSCRRRKRRCDEEKPICASCRRTGAECVYPNSPSATTPMKFIVATSSSHHMLPIQRSNRRASFLNLTPHDLEVFCPKFQSTDNDQVQHDSENDDAVDLRWDSNAGSDTQLLRIVSPFTFAQTSESLRTLETALVQYYAEVISSSRAYVPTGRNCFLTSVMPHILLAQGPLLSTVLAMSAAEWGQNVVTNGKDYRALSAQYKVRALGELQRSLCDGGNAEESLLTCVLMSSLEIASGSRPAWLRHLHGAVALLDSFATTIDPSVTKFALDYFRFRYILLKTTEPRPHTEQPVPADAPEASYDHAMTCLVKAESSLPFLDDFRTLIDEHTGCSMEVVDIINQITALSLAVGQNNRQETRDHLYSEGQVLEHKIRQMNLDAPSEYLVKSAECFKIAAQIYLRLVCFDTSITHPSILEPHQDLLDLLSSTIVEGQPRRSFPMWPLFIAGCTCSSDDQRKTVLDLFTILDGQWPISNIAAVWKAVRTVWQARDLSASPLSCKHDWQEIIHKFGWKLALS